MAYTNSNIQIHGAGTGAYSHFPHSGGPNLYMSLTADNFYRNADKSVWLNITQAYLKAGSYNYPFDVSVGLVVGNITDYATQIPQLGIWSESKLFSKPHGTNTWSDNQIKLTSTLTLAAPNPNDLPVHIVIGMQCICLCDVAAGVDSTVYGVNVSSYVPKVEPYFWKMQHAKDPTVTTGTLNWHLARPFYICKTINGVKGWCSCEDQTKLVYDANGNKIH